LIVVGKGKRNHRRPMIDRSPDGHQTRFDRRNQRSVGGQDADEEFYRIEDSDRTHMKQLSLKEIQEKYSATVSPAILRKLQRDPRTGARKLYKVFAKRYDEQKKERNRLDAMLHFERLLWRAGIQHIAGVDEVGMGPLAGP